MFLVILLPCFSKILTAKNKLLIKSNNSLPFSRIVGQVKFIYHLSFIICRILSILLWRKAGNLYLSNKFESYLINDTKFYGKESRK